ncbi:putative exonuclease V, mitochondrial [Cryptosporidium felis]|nr:putative exonuclease V, mitochondrial [Cryptosporidium felis]
MNVSSFKIKRRKKSEGIEDKVDISSNHDELLEFVPPIDKFKSKHILGVTTFSRQMWCEKSLEICLEKNIKVTSKAIEEGLKHHEELELEDHDVISVLVENEYERISLDILSIVNLLGGLIERGYIRELPIIGFFNGIMLRGIIDSIQLKPKFQGINSANTNGYDQKYIEKFVILISDTKTRREKTLPSAVQQKTTVLQLGLYRKILGEMIKLGKDWKINHPYLTDRQAIKTYAENSSTCLSNCCTGCQFLNTIFKFYGLDPSIQFLKFRELELAEVINTLDAELNCEVDPNSNMETKLNPESEGRETKLGNKDEITTETKENETEIETKADGLEVLKDFSNALEICYNMLNNLSKLPEIKQEMKVEYDCQGKTFATKWYKSPEETVNLELDYLLGWWFGMRNTEYVRISESWKCRFCNVIEYCEVCPLSDSDKKKCVEQIRQNELDSLLLKDLEDSSSN